MKLLEKKYYIARDLRDNDVDYAKNNFIAQMCYIYLNKQSECLDVIKKAKEFFKDQPDLIEKGIETNFEPMNGANSGVEYLSDRSWRNELFSNKPDRATNSILFNLTEEYVYFAEIKDEYPKHAYTEVAKLELGFYDDEQVIIDKIDDFWNKNKNVLNIIYKKDAKLA